MVRTSCLGLAVALLIACSGGAPKITDATPATDASVDGVVIEEIDAGIDAPVDAPADAAIDAPIGHPGTGTVTGAIKASSPGYKLYGTLRSGDGSSASPSYQRRGGITGATQP